VKNPKISVIIPVYNEEKFLSRCLRSLFSQNLDDDLYEIVIINDASTDNTKTILNNYLDDIKLITNTANIGLAASLNKGINASKGKFIVRVDGDDYVHEQYLNILSLFLELNNDIDAVACDYYLVDDRQNSTKKFNCLENPIGCGVMYRYEQIIDIGLFDPSFLAREEEELNIRFSEKYSKTRIPIPLYKYHLHDNNLTSNKALMDHYQQKLLKKHTQK